MLSRLLRDSRNGRFLTFGLLYVSEGIPYGFSSIAMVAFMRQQGLSLALIGTFVAALFLPWAFKWAWAPVIDLVKLHLLGGREAWIVTCTVMMVVTLLVAATASCMPGSISALRSVAAVPCSSMAGSVSKRPWRASLACWS